MEESKRVIFAGVLFLVFVVFCLAIYYFFIYDKTKEGLPVEEVAEEQPAQFPEEKEDILGEEGELLQAELDESDDIVRKLAEELSTHRRLAIWLKSKDLIRKFTAAVDNIANGLSPRPQIEFFSPEDDFKAKERDGLFYMDPESYSRYDLVADVFLTLNPSQCAKLYKQSKLLLQEAYQDLGYPEGDFHKTLTKAIIELLEVPVVEGNIALEKKVVTFMMADPKLEGLSEAQKHLLRMGPENIQITQEKLRKIAGALGIPEDQLPH